MRHLYPKSHVRFEMTTGKRSFVFEQALKLLLQFSTGLLNS